MYWASTIYQYWSPFTNANQCLSYLMYTTAWQCPLAPESIDAHSSPFVPRGRHSLLHQTTANVLKSSCHQIPYCRVRWSCIDSKQGDRRDWGISIFWSRGSPEAVSVSFPGLTSHMHRANEVFLDADHSQLPSLLTEWALEVQTFGATYHNHLWTLTFFFKNQIPAFHYFAALTPRVTVERSQGSELPPLISVSADITE